MDESATSTRYRECQETVRGQLSVLLVFQACTVYCTDFLFFKIWSQDPMEARNSTGSTMIGVGLSMEGINQNEVMYEFMNEMSWRTHPVDLDEW